jgi:hypothetical protein
MSEITRTAREELNSLKSDAFVVLWGGATDISRNNTKEPLNLLFEFMNQNKELSVVLINSPHRHEDGDGNLASKISLSWFFW